MDESACCVWQNQKHISTSCTCALSSRRAPKLMGISVVSIYNGSSNNREVFETCTNVDDQSSPFIDMVKPIF